MPITKETGVVIVCVFMLNSLLSAVFRVCVCVYAYKIARHWALHRI